jgi:hypothetical protein
MRSATASRASSASSKTASNSSPKKAVNPKIAACKTASLASSNSAPENSGHGSQMHKRSASFHYPDGTSRVTHSVYSSEDDFEDDDEEPRLYEVNEDELFLAYDSGGVIAPKRKPSSPRCSAAASTTSGSSSKLEALDNLVISTIFSVSTKLCMMSGKLVRSLQERTSDKEEEAMLETLVSYICIWFGLQTRALTINSFFKTLKVSCLLYFCLLFQLYVLEDVDPPVSPSKKTSRELAGTLRIERSDTDV